MSSPVPYRQPACSASMQFGDSLVQCVRNCPKNDWDISVDTVCSRRVVGRCDESYLRLESQSGTLSALIDIGESDPNTIQVIEVFVGRQECRPGFMSGRCNPEIILCHWDSRSWRRGLRGSGHRFPVGPGINQSIRTQNAPLVNVNRRKILQHVLEPKPFVPTPAILFSKRKKLAPADDGSKDHRLPVSQIEHLPSPNCPWRLPNETEQRARVQQIPTFH